VGKSTKWRRKEMMKKCVGGMNDYGDNGHQGMEERRDGF
jgi:hypothetical protein